VVNPLHSVGQICRVTDYRWYVLCGELDNVDPGARGGEPQAYEVVGSVNIMIGQGITFGILMPTYVLRLYSQVWPGHDQRRSA
jgi:hypothetical protein